MADVSHVPYLGKGGGNAEDLGAVKLLSPPRLGGPHELHEVGRATKKN